MYGRLAGKKFMHLKPEGAILIGTGFFMFKNSAKYVYLLAVALPLLPSCAFAQAVAGLGAISGTARDASGAVVSDATVTITNSSNGFNRRMQTTEGGLFAAASVTPTSGYKIEVEKPGFAKWQSEDFAVLVGQTVDFKVNLQVGSSSTKVEVTAEAPLIENTKSGVTASVGQLQIDNLPINGRRVDSYVLMTPAVVKDGEFGLLSFRGIAAGNRSSPTATTPPTASTTRTPAARASAARFPRTPCRNFRCYLTASRLNSDAPWAAL